MSARSRELFGLLPVSLLVTAGFTAVLITRADEVQAASVTYGVLFLGACVFAHVFIRARLKDADPYLFPLAALLTAFGLVMIYRIDEELARGQAIVFAIALALFCATIVFLRDHRVLERYRYTIAAAGLVLLLLPRAPVIGGQVNGAYLAVDLGITQFQPAEFAKLAIIVFLASYLNDTREVLTRGRTGPPSVRRALPVVAVAAGAGLLLHLVLDLGLWPSLLTTVLLALGAEIYRERPSLKHFGPLLLVWGLAMMMIVVIQDLGAGLMFFGGFLALLYIATQRLSFVAFGLALFAAGATVFANSLSHVQERVEIWLDPFARGVVEDEGYQVAQSLFAQADGGLFGEGFGQALLVPPGGGAPILPAAHTDLIYALIVNEVGLFGAAAVVLVALLLAARGFKTAMLAEDGFSKLLAAGLTAVFALQVFVIIGGVTRVIPLTGVTLPFVSYGGSSLVANFVLLALLLVVSDHARSDARRSRPGGLV
ncbi:MAG TPA: FtsW/RodA/SpoVE family cell cycle protein [Thermoleophilaceae bacterium]|nr:FtsW/RodA/SpoVE family cell cycle protein [Thermoleophilaceae bacterium]